MDQGQVRLAFGPDVGSFGWSLGGYSFCDPLTAALLTDVSPATIEDRNLCVVETERPASGWTRPGEECPQVRVAVSADGGRCERILVHALNVPSP